MTARRTIARLTTRRLIARRATAFLATRRLAARLLRAFFATRRLTARLFRARFFPARLTAALLTALFAKVTSLDQCAANARSEPSWIARHHGDNVIRATAAVRHTVSARGFVTAAREPQPLSLYGCHEQQ